MKFSIVNSYADMTPYIDNIDKEFNIDVLANADDEPAVFAEIDSLAELVTLMNTVENPLILSNYPKYRKRQMEKLYPDFPFPQLEVEIYDGCRE